MLTTLDTWRNKLMYTKEGIVINNDVNWNGINKGALTIILTTMVVFLVTIYLTVIL